MNKNLREVRAVTPADRFSQVNKIAKFSHIKGENVFLALGKVCNILSWSSEMNIVIIATVILWYVD